MKNYFLLLISIIAIITSCSDEPDEDSVVDSTKVNELFDNVEVAINNTNNASFKTYVSTTANEYADINVSLFPVTNFTSGGLDYIDFHSPEIPSYGASINVAIKYNVAEHGDPIPYITNDSATFSLINEGSESLPTWKIKTIVLTGSGGGAEVLAAPKLVKPLLQ